MMPIYLDVKIDGVAASGFDSETVLARLANADVSEEEAHYLRGLLADLEVSHAD